MILNVLTAVIMLFMILPPYDEPEPHGVKRPAPTVTPTPTATPTPFPTATRPRPTAPPVPTAIPQPPGPDHVVAIGDSVMKGAAAQLAQRLGDVEVDATVGRQAGNGLALLEGRAQAGTLGPYVVVHLGNNGNFTARQFDAIMGLLANAKRVVFVTVAVPRKWAATNNAMLAEAVARYPNAALVDWQAAATANTGLFWGDGIHLRPAGAKLYAELIAEALGR